MTASSFLAPNRYITDNNDDGDSFFSTALSTNIPVADGIPGVVQRLAYTTEPPPVQLSDEADLQSYQNALNEKPALVKSNGGSNFWYLDMPPGSESPMHRTVSVDIVILLKGELELTLSNNDTRIIKPGDMVLQRSTLHKWRNTSDTEWVRIFAVMTGCQQVKTKNAGELGESFLAY
ncbi:hypothetical protein ETB97_003495 [Aspergillus alliaceus]|uniref:Cupin type-2 domain-containing protein n=1 Tax=Petromyces alliaceus TaxID=209559 RepID=A0A8H6E4E7_PETAA|nr:hypothetical protein ETB97_003495 [Aspergillus burnettii]